MISILSYQPLGVHYPGSYFLLKQSVTVDQKRYLEILEKTDTFAFMSERQIMQYIGSLTPGKAIVKLPNSEQRIVQLYQRSSQHISHTPKVSSAMSRYSSLSFNPNMRFGADMEGEPAPAKRKPAPALLVSTSKNLCKKCGAPATHTVNYSSGRRGYFCSEHASQSCKSL